MFPRPQFHISRRRLLALPHHYSSKPRLLSSTSIPTAQIDPARVADAPPFKKNTENGRPQFEPLDYHVHRTPSQELPVYHLRKAGGTLLQTLLRKVEGDRTSLIGDLRSALGLQEKDIKINAVNGHIVIKGLRKQAVKQFLESKHF